jgi:DNA-binding winged helix-turn-helix (wHTH) protein
MYGKNHKTVDRQTNQVFIEGLKRKGYLFDSSKKIEQFAASRCSKQENQLENCTTYLVDNQPFLIHSHQQTIDVSNVEKEGFIITASAGSFAFV